MGKLHRCDDATSHNCFDVLYVLYKHSDFLETDIQRNVTVGGGFHYSATQWVESLIYIEIGQHGVQQPYTNNGHNEYINLTLESSEIY